MATPARVAAIRRDHHGDAEQEPKRRVTEPEDGKEEAEDEEGDPVEPADGSLLGEDAQRVGRCQLAHRQCPDDDGHCLRAGVAAHRGDDRHQDSAPRAGRSPIFELGDDQGSDDHGAEVDEQPQEAAQPSAHRWVKDVEFGHAAEPECILLRLLLHDLDHVVDRDHAEQAPSEKLTTGAEAKPALAE